MFLGMFDTGSTLVFKLDNLTGEAETGTPQIRLEFQDANSRTEVVAFTNMTGSGPWTYSHLSVTDGSYIATMKITINGKDYYEVDIADVGVIQITGGSGGGGVSGASKTIVHIP